MTFWDRYPTWDDAKAAWDEQSQAACYKHPLKRLKSQPAVPAITKQTKRNLRWKTLKYLVSHDKEGIIKEHILKRPFYYGKQLLRSWMRKRSYEVDGDLFFYGTDLKKFEELLQDPDTLLVLGFSYCHKPFECPSKRFNDLCLHDSENGVCQQCFIGQCIHASSKDTVVYAIPTIHYIGKKMMELVDDNPDKKVIFVITACEMTLQMFGDWGNMAGLVGIGVRLGGRVCNTLKAFELSERGVKPGLTVVSEETQEKVLKLIRLRREKERGKKR